MDPLGSGKISSRYFAIKAKNKSLAGQSSIGVLAVCFSRIWALKKHAPLIFSVYVSFYSWGSIFVNKCNSKIELRGRFLKGGVIKWQTKASMPYTHVWTEGCLWVMCPPEKLKKLCWVKDMYRWSMQVGRTLLILGRYKYCVMCPQL